MVEDGVGQDVVAEEIQAMVEYEKKKNYLCH